MKKVLLALLLVLSFVFVGCEREASIASYNMSRDADEFKIYRRVVFYNGITDEYILSVEGFCSINVDSTDKQLELTVKTGENEYKKHYLGLSDNVTYFAEQLEPSTADPYHYKVIFKPSTIIPDIDLDLNY